ncbi:MAG: hypothetical protein K2J32_06710 [Ruminococcus sp.]|nr:hypothetical protein [Ruminococcus sp.]
MKSLIVVFSCLILLTFPVLTANARNILQNLVVISSELPNDAVYIDILISMNENDESYTPFNESNMKQYNFDTKDINEYNNEDFISMSCHYKYNFTEMKIQPDSRGKYVNSFTLREFSAGNFGPNPSLVL